MPNRTDNPSRPASVRDGWEWVVLPSSSDEPMIACGVSADEAVARMCVEEVMTRVPSALLGFLDHPHGETEQCRRTRDGGLKWMPLFGGSGR